MSTGDSEAERKRWRKELFCRTWQILSEKGLVDGLGSCEFRLVYREWARVRFPYLAHWLPGELHARHPQEHGDTQD